VRPFVVVYVGLALVGSLMALAQRRWPAGTPPPLDRSRTNDLAWWLFSPFVTGTLTRIATLGVVFSVARLAGYGALAGDLIDRVRSVIPWRVWAHPTARQWVECLALADLVGYWSHRLRHSAWLWPFHAVHHSATRLDGLAAARMHPLDDLVDNVAVGLVMVLFAREEVFELLGATLMVHTVFTHAAVRCDLGPLRYVLVSPTFHRWHHAAEKALPGCNFAGMFSLYDLVFGTFFCPVGALPARFGTPDDPVPETLLAQLAHPFRVLAARLR
jgi:sterol desaturase/sphingolipid hydroxylase (fatty acid hydroxylase superfamily)